MVSRGGPGGMGGVQQQPNLVNGATEDRIGLQIQLHQIVKLSQPPHTLLQQRHLAAFYGPGPGRLHILPILRHGGAKAE